MDGFLDAFRVQRVPGVVSEKDRKQFRCSYLRGSNDLAPTRNVENNVPLSIVRALGESDGEALFAKFLASSANQGRGPPRRALD